MMLNTLTEWTWLEPILIAHSHSKHTRMIVSWAFFRAYFLCFVYFFRFFSLYFALTHVTVCVHKIVTGKKTRQFLLSTILL